MMNPHRDLLLAGLLAAMALLSACSEAPPTPIDDDRPPPSNGGGASTTLSATPGTPSVSAGGSTQVRIDLQNVPPGTVASGYSIDLDEQLTDIDITTAPCTTGARGASCQDWTITPGPNAVPGRYIVNVRATGLGSTVADQFMLTVVGIEPVAGALLARKAATSNEHWLVIANEGRIYANGYNSMGQLGAGSEYTAFGSPQRRVTPFDTNEFVPVEFSANAPSRDFIAVAAMGDRSYALNEDGTVWAWGSNLSRTLGVGSAHDSETLVLRPAQVELPPHVLQISSLRFVSQLLVKVNGQAVLIGGTSPQAQTVRKLDGTPLPEITDIAGSGRHLLLRDLAGHLWRGVANGNEIAAVELTGLPPAAFMAVGEDRQDRDNAIAAIIDETGSMWTWSSTGDLTAPHPEHFTTLDGEIDDMVIADGTIFVSFALDHSIATFHPTDTIPPRRNVGHAIAGGLAPGVAVDDCGRLAFFGALENFFDSNVFGCGEHTPRSHLGISIIGRGRVVSQVSASPGPQIDCPGVCDTDVFVGSTVSFVTTADPGWRFQGWMTRAGSGIRFCDRATVIAAADSGCIAVFEEIPPDPPGTRLIPIDVIGSGTVTDPSGTLHCHEGSPAADCTLRLLPTERFELHADSWKLDERAVKWGGICTGTAQQAQMAIVGSVGSHCTATFLPSVDLTLRVTGGGTLARDVHFSGGTCGPAVPPFSCVLPTTRDQPVDIGVLPTDGFDHWMGCDSLVGPFCHVTPTTARTVEAVFH